ncbi:MAG: zf-TFIIB domain-containing protein [Bdellovibrio sp.]|jgi:Zn-finger nucleic acid-binding protein
MKCPACKDPSLVLSERQGIEIDYCPECRGIWLDRGELDKILEKSIRSDEPQHRADSRDSSYSRDSNSGSHHKPYKRKKSFLEEIFD